ncbi:MAG: hypothetical protein OEZ13_11900 [Spirochaetia bacterium]|nr:hypothetical protein [Spirochaetia bacterium]
MKCKKQPLGAKTEIKNVWEVRMDLSLWNKIVCASKVRKKTYSWIVRYCVFELAKVKKLRWTKSMLNIHENIKSSKKDAQHRHMLCLYGADEMLLRNSALILGVTVTQLVRISLLMFIDRLVKGKTSDKRLFWFGIKLFSEICVLRSMKDNMLAMVFHSHRKFSREEYWGFS